MVQPNQQVAQILLSVLQASKLPPNNSTKLTLASNPEHQQLTITRQALTSVISKLVQRKDSTIDKYKNEISRLQASLEKASETIVELLQAQRKKDSKTQQENRQRKTIQQLQRKIEIDLRKREQLELQLRLSQNRVKEQLSQLEKLKHTIAARQAFIKNIVGQKKKKDNANKPAEEEGQQLPTPTKLDSTFVEISSSFNRQIVEPGRSHLLYSDKQPLEHSFSSKFSSIQCKRVQSTSHVRVSQFDLSSELPLRMNTKNEDKFYRHSTEGDKKDKMMKKLAEKCLFLESHIEILTKKLLGYLGNEMPIECKGYMQELRPTTRENRCNVTHQSRFLMEVEREKSACKIKQ